MAKKGYLFVRYADDFVILCKRRSDAERALENVQVFLEKMGLETNSEKTKIRHFSKGFEFLGFTIKNKSIQMRIKAREKFKNKIREVSKRSHNLNKEVIIQLNRVIRGTVNYFGIKSSTMKSSFKTLDQWIRKRIRCMKYKRIQRTDNRRLQIKHIEKMGLLNCCNLYKERLKC